MTYKLGGRRDYAVRLGCEKGLYDYLQAYADKTGMSLSGVVRRLILIGIRCEKEHDGAETYEV